MLFEGVVGPIRDIGGGRDQGDAAAVRDQAFGQHAAHVIVVVVVDQDIARRPLAAHQVVGGQ